jgi:hypothetical protein
MKRYFEETKDSFILVAEEDGKISIRTFSKGEMIPVKAVNRARGEMRPPVPNVNVNKKEYDTNLIITTMDGKKVIIEKILGGGFKEK